MCRYVYACVYARAGVYEYIGNVTHAYAGNENMYANILR